MLLYSLYLCWAMTIGGSCVMPWTIGAPVSPQQCRDDLRVIKGLDSNGAAYCRAIWIKK